MMDMSAVMPTFESMAPVAEHLMLVHTVISGLVLQLWFSNQLAVTAAVYTGSLVGLTMCLCSAAYVVVKTVDAAYDTLGYAFVYRGASITGNNLGLYELLAILLFITWALVLVIVSLVGAS